MSVEIRTVDSYPEIEKVWDNPPSSLIVDPVSNRTSINTRRINPNSIAFLGAQKGDEAKGTWSGRFAHMHLIVDEINAAFRGGAAGAGHSLIPEGLTEEIVMRMLPASIDDEWVKVAGRGELVNPEIVLREIKMLKELGYHPSPKNVMIDGAAFLAWDAHVERDKAEEIRRGKNAVGTTKSGVGPAASDYTGRNGMQIYDLLLPPKDLEEKVADEVDRQNKLLQAFGSDHYFEFQQTLETFKMWSKELSHYIQNTYPVAKLALNKGRIIYEGAQAFGISRDTGFQGAVTSTDSGLGSFARRYRTSENNFRHRLGVAKLVPTCVGNHIIHSPLPENMQEILYGRTAERGAPEQGAVSGRRRQYYWLSIPELRAAIETYNLNELVISKVDACDNLREIHFGMEYIFPDGNTTTDYDPDDPRMLDSRTQMNTLKLDGWQKSTAGLNRFEDAPHELRSTIATLEHLVGVPVVAIGTGPKFGEAIYADNSPFQVLEAI